MLHKPDNIISYRQGLISGSDQRHGFSAGPELRRRLYQEVADHIEFVIRDGDPAEGESLPSERELMDQFAVGRSAIQKALLSLQQKGLILVGNGEPARVARPDADQSDRCTVRRRSGEPVEGRSCRAEQRSSPKLADYAYGLEAGRITVEVRACDLVTDDAVVRAYLGA